jgi:prephenate dehydratase
MMDVAAGGNGNGMVVAYQGVPGSFSFEAAENYFGTEVEFRPYQSFAQTMTAVVEKGAAYGVVPVENSSTGTISEVYDLLLQETNLSICGELTLPIKHCLLALPGADLAMIREVRSHPQGLLQCKEYLMVNHLRGVPGMNTAICAAEIAQSGDLSLAAVASRAAAKAYGLKVLVYDINDITHNATRFIVISAVAGPGGKKTSVVFHLSHQPGSLYNSLGSFAGRGVDLLRIESRPLRERPFEYSFIIDVAGDAKQQPLADALADLASHVSYLRILGSYDPK